jgi:hypothetical protein
MSQIMRGRIEKIIMEKGSKRKKSNYEDQN